MYARSPVHGSLLLMFCSRENLGRKSDARKEGDVVRITALGSAGGVSLAGLTRFGRLVLAASVFTHSPYTLFTYNRSRVTD